MRMRRLAKLISGVEPGFLLFPSVYRDASLLVEEVRPQSKDTASPSRNILIKLMAMVSVVFAGLVVNFSPIIVGGIVGIR